jgi:hypothetical protein
VQLWTHLASGWQTPQRYTYTAATCIPVAQMSLPMPGSALTGNSAAFSWTAAAGADNYWLDVGNSIGQGDISAGSTVASSQNVSGLPCDGRTLHVQLWTHFASGWQTPQRYTYAAATCSSVAQMSLPIPGSPLSGISPTFSWTPVAGADSYWLDVGNSTGQGDISAGATTATARTVSGLPCDGRTLFVQLWTHFASGWRTPQRYTYTACH